MGRREAYGIKKSKVKKLITGKWTNLEFLCMYVWVRLFRVENRISTVFKQFTLQSYGTTMKKSLLFTRVI